jgi:hypothetical protein
MPFSLSEAITVTIANGASLSGAARLDMRQVTAIQMPAAWTAAPLTFRGSTDAATFFDLFDPFGAEVTVQAAASRLIMIPPNGLGGFTSLIVRSGTSAAAVNQGAARDIILFVRSFV